MNSLTEKRPNAEAVLRPYADVYVAPLPDRLPNEPLFPPLRQREIDACKNERVRREKYFVWRLLAHAVFERYGKELHELQFTRSDNGKWSCDLCEFSLSHSKGALCAAISDAPVGVDIERIPDGVPDSAARKILTEEELQRYHGMPQSKKNEFFARSWTRRESLFKRAGASGFFTADPAMLTGETQTAVIVLNGERYVLSAAFEKGQNVRIQTIGEGFVK